MKAEAVRVLHIEDNRFDRELVHDVLVKQNKGFKLNSVKTRKEFEKKLAQPNYDIILSDFNILGFEGLELLDLVKASKPEIPVVILTGTGSEEIATESMKRGAADYVLKTNKHIRKLALTINKVLDIQRTEQARQESEDKYRELFNNLNDAIYLWELKQDRLPGRLIEVNEGASKMLGYPRDELLKLGIKDLTPDVGATLPKRIFELLESKDILFETYHQTKGGDKVPVEIKAHLFDLRGEKVILAMVRDISKRKQLEDQLIHAQKMEAVGRLAGGVAHDLNNLLTVILGNVEFGLQDTLPESPVQEDLKNIEQAAEQARDLVKQLLSFGRRQLLSLDQLDLNESISELMRMVKRVIGENIKVKTILDSDIDPVHADITQIQQVLMNLVVNARDAMPKGGELTIMTRNFMPDEDFKTLQSLETPVESLEETDRFVEISVTDKGSGMDDTTRKHIFDPFFTTKDVGEGSGLGLAVVYGIIKQHKGIVRVDSELGKGSRFRIYLPAFKKSRAKSQTKTKDPIITSGKETILLVEDEEAVQNVTARILEKLGYGVLRAKDGNEAIRVLKKEKNKIDISIIDIVMPDISGPEAYKEMSKIKPELPVVFITGYDIHDKIAELGKSQQESVTLIQKPFTKNSLGTKIRQVLDEH